MDAMTSHQPSTNSASAALDQLHGALALAFQLYHDLVGCKSSGAEAQALQTAISLNQQMLALVEASFASEPAQLAAQLEAERNEASCPISLHTIHNSSLNVSRLACNVFLVYLQMWSPQADRSSGGRHWQVAIGLD
jgi:hypothetical protein